LHLRSGWPNKEEADIAPIAPEASEQTPPSE